MISVADHRTVPRGSKSNALHSLRVCMVVQNAAAELSGSTDSAKVCRIKSQVGKFMTTVWIGHIVPGYSL